MPVSGFTEMRSGSEAGSYAMLKDSCVTQLNSRLEKNEAEDKGSKFRSMLHVWFLVSGAECLAFGN